MLFLTHILKKRFHVTVSVLWWILVFMDFTITFPFDMINYTNVYGENYGTKWIYFPNGDGKPQYVNLRTLNRSDIRSSTTKEIDFNLYIGNDTDSYITLNEHGQPLQESNQDMAFSILSTSKQVKIVTHGWRSYNFKGNDGIGGIKKAYLETKKFKVITVDWGKGSLYYPQAATDVKIVGARVGNFINALHRKYNVFGKQIHLIGHSLGAHVMGVAAARSKFGVNRVTGLDPARPFFEYPLVEGMDKLDSMDAHFVDIIHTCRGILGIEEAVGTVDFYPNNGLAPQPGCASVQKILETCSHGRALQYFLESIESPFAFPAYQCESWLEYSINGCKTFSYMGENVDMTMRGVFYLKTNSYPPFGSRL